MSLVLLCWDCKQELPEAEAIKVRVNPHSKSDTQVCRDCWLTRGKKGDTQSQTVTQREGNTK